MTATSQDPVAQDDTVEISVVSPFYNEEANIAELHQRLTTSLKELGSSYELIFVNDGSTDATPAIMHALHEQDQRLVGVHLSRNFGHQAAICAGIDYACGRAVIVMDGDLQDPPEVLEEFVKRWREGHDVVYAIREKRKEGLLKRAGYFWFYRLLRLTSDLDIPVDSGDFCLMDRRVVDVLRSLPERKRFVRGLRTFVGFRQVGLHYKRAARKAGKPKYTLGGLVGLAVDGLVNFSSYPLHLVTYVGFGAVGVAALLAVWVVAEALSKRSVPPGWASTIVVVLFMSAVQLISLGIIGEYIRRIFLESKGRPTYIVQNVEGRRRTNVEPSPRQPVPRWRDPVPDGGRRHP